MKTIFLLIFIGTCFFTANAQIILDTSTAGSSIVIQDARIEMLGEKLADHNATIKSANNANTPTTGTKTVITTTSTGIVLTQGYRLMVISTSDRDLAMKVRARLLQTFSDQVLYKIYMSFQMPNTKIRFGNFLDRGQADRVRKQIMAMKIVTNNIYIVPDTVEMKVEKTTTKEVDDDKSKDKKKEKVKGK
jgi:SPOR domain